MHVIIIDMIIKKKQYNIINRISRLKSKDKLISMVFFFF